MEYIDVTLSYIAEAGKIPDEKKLFKVVKQLETVSEEKLMTIAEHFKQKGKLEAAREYSLKCVTGVIISVSSLSGLGNKFVTARR